jgi:hypothetical protein
MVYSCDIRKKLVRAIASVDFVGKCALNCSPYVLVLKLPYGKRFQRDNC